MNMTMVGRLTDCILLTYRSPAKSVEHLIPDGLALVTHAGQSFWNIVACHVIRMRPSGTPSALGLTYTHVAYRLYVHTTGTAQRMTGLYFVRSDVDNRLVGAAGNWLTDFRFNTSRIDYTVEDGIALSVTASDGNANASLLAAPMDRFSLSRDSCFDTIQQAMATLKYQPTALSVGKHSIRCADVSRKESEWRESPLQVIDARWHFLESLRQDGLHLETASRLMPLDYRWQLGRTVPRQNTALAKAL